MLLIRSQDKKNFVNIDIVKCISIINNNTIVADFGQDFSIVLGYYTTCARAIEVMDLLEKVHNSLNHNCPAEIQRGIVGNLINGISGYGFVRNGTYDMPQE